MRISARGKFNFYRVRQLCINYLVKQMTWRKSLPNDVTLSISKKNVCNLAQYQIDLKIRSWLSLFSSPFTQSPVNTLAIANVRAQTRKGRIVRAPRNWTCDSATSPQHRWIIKVIARSIKLNIRFAVKRVDQKKHSEYMLNLTMKATLKGAVKRDYE